MARLRSIRRRWTASEVVVYLTPRCHPGRRNCRHCAAGAWTGASMSFDVESERRSKSSTVGEGDGDRDGVEIGLLPGYDGSNCQIVVRRTLGVGRCHRQNTTDPRVAGGRAECDASSGGRGENQRLFDGVRCDPRVQIRWLHSATANCAINKGFRHWTKCMHAPT